MLTELDLWIKTLVKSLTNKSEVNRVSVLLFTVCPTESQQLLLQQSTCLE